jgi:iron complex transport system permease protein
MSCTEKILAAGQGRIVKAYLEGLNQKIFLFIILAGLTFLSALYAMAHGAYDIPVKDVLSALTGNSQSAARVVVMNIRMPRVISSIIAGWGLSLSGLCLQSLLKNPLGDPWTLGISQGAAFGAASAIVFFGTGIVSVTAFAFGGATAASLIILVIARLKRLSPEAIILSGIALASLFTAATVLIQYMANEIQLAAVVFWTFGDAARPGWFEIGLMTAAVSLAAIYLYTLRWDFNAMSAGEDTAKGLGVNVERIRVAGMLAVCLVTALVTAFLGAIAFMGLVAPHIARRIIGDDHRVLIPFSAVLGGLLLLTADTSGRLLMGSGSLPVGVITSFLGAPVFLYLLIRGYR